MSLDCGRKLEYPKADTGRWCRKAHANQRVWIFLMWFDSVNHCTTKLLIVNIWNYKIEHQTPNQLQHICVVKLWVPVKITQKTTLQLVVIWMESVIFAYTGACTVFSVGIHCYVVTLSLPAMQIFPTPRIPDQRLTEARCLEHACSYCKLRTCCYSWIKQLGPVV